MIEEKKIGKISLYDAKYTIQSSVNALNIVVHRMDIEKQDLTSYEMGLIRQVKADLEEISRKYWDLGIF